MTKLEAVNLILRKCGSFDVPALDTGGSSTAARVENVLDAEELKIQMESGWHYNTRENIALTPDGVTNKISVPTGCLQITANAVKYSRFQSSGPDGVSAGHNITQIGTYVYDLANNTFEFTDSIVLFRVRLRVSFECIPPVIREYIAEAAATRYCEQYMDDPRKCRYLREQEMAAQTRARRFNNEAADVNILDTPSARRMRGVSSGWGVGVSGMPGWGG